MYLPHNAVLHEDVHSYLPGSDAARILMYLPHNAVLHEDVRLD